MQCVLVKVSSVWYEPAAGLQVYSDEWTDVKLFVELNSFKKIYPVV